MIEVNKTFNLYPNIDREAVKALVKKSIGALLRAPGVVEVRGYRNVLGSPQRRISVVWQTLADWGNFAESNPRWALDAELSKYASDIRIEVWGPSPNIPEPLHPKK